MTDETEKPFNLESYMKGINDGHLLAKYAPPVADLLAKSDNRSEWFEGMREGQKLYLLSKARDNRPKWLEEKHPDHSGQPAKNKDKEADKDR